MVGRGATYADIDGDGDLDLLLVANGGSPRLLRNDSKNENNWLRVRLNDRAKTGAIGATITIPLANGDKLVRCISPTRSYLSQTELTATFGLGNQSPKDMQIDWPNGEQQTLPIDQVNTLMIIDQPAG
jgi:hypothetical protein